MKEYLMTVSVGPVQDFIAAARKLRDLWFGSYLLSELSKQAARSLRKNGAELIFPAPESEKDLETDSDLKVPNKLLVKVACDDPRAFFYKVRKEILSFWKEELATKTIEKSRELIEPAIFEKQIEDLLEIYGAWTPFIKGEYQKSRGRADRILAARKSLRNFQQAFDIPTSGGGGRPKSSLDGLRESVLQENPSESEKRRMGIKDFEELDAPGWIKRHGKRLNDREEQRPDFDSLSDLAADPFLRKAVKNKKTYELMEELGSALQQQAGIIQRIHPLDHRSSLKGVSAQCLYVSRLQQELSENENCNPAQVKEMLKLLQKIYSETGEKQGPIPYTAILLGDGDNMGKTIDEIEDIRIHQHFSKALNRFAVSCESLVKNHYGCLIYSGGDDVLAFIPLDQVLQCADEIQKNFATEMKEALPDEDRIPTFSIGIAMVHHLQPMGMSLQLAREAEKMAKNVGDRNALAIILDKRSGVPLNICAKWNSGIVKRLSDWTNYHFHDLMPDKLAYELRHLAKEMGDELKWEKGKPANATAFEFERILKRKRAKRGSKEMDADIIRTAGSLDNLRNLADELILTRLIADAVKQSGKETI